MRLRLDLVLLALLTILLILSLAYLFRPGEFRYAFSRPDSIYPRPVLRLAFPCKGEVMVVSGDYSISCPIPRSFMLRVTLINNSSEPSVKQDFAAGFLLVFEGARVGGLKLGGFDGAIGVNESGQLIDPINSTMLEFFTGSLGPWQSKTAEILLIKEANAKCVKIAYRGWIMDEDDVVRNPASGDKEPYTARYPPENPLTNPPDTRWAGKDFLKYETYEIEICP